MSMKPDLRARNAKPNSRTSFGDFCLGLYLITAKDGTKTWRCNYTLNGYHMVVLGRYPDMTPADAKLERLKVKDAVKRKINPAIILRDEKAANEAAANNTVRSLADEWLPRQPAVRSWSEDYAKQVRARLENHVFPEIGSRPVSSITTRDIQRLVDGMRSKGMYAQAVHVRQHLQLLFDYAFSHDDVTVNVVRKIGRELAPRDKTAEVQRARVGTIEEARQVLAAVESARAGGFLKLVHRLIALTAVRKMEAVGATWSEFDEVKQIWTIPATRMKGRKGQKQDHVIPLAPQAVEVFQAARQLAEALGKPSPMVFPGRGVDCVKRSSLNDLTTRLGLAGRHTIHGWRGTFSTIQNDEQWEAKMIIDAMLAHQTKSNVEGRYNGAKYLEARLKIACAWADKLLLGAPSAFEVAGVKRHHDNVVPFKREAA